LSGRSQSNMSYPAWFLTVGTRYSLTTFCSLLPTFICFLHRRCRIRLRALDFSEDYPLSLDPSQLLPYSTFLVTLPPPSSVLNVPSKVNDLASCLEFIPSGLELLSPSFFFSLTKLRRGCDAGALGCVFEREYFLPSFFPMKVFSAWRLSSVFFLFHGLQDFLPSPGPATFSNQDLDCCTSIFKVAKSVLRFPPRIPCL